jgi:nucleotide-binding universal stress UspA family protein
MNILLPVDGSEQSATAVQTVLKRPWPSGSNVRILAVVENAGPPPVGELMLSPAVDLGQLRQQNIANAEKLIAEVAASLRASGLSVDKTVREGDASNSIIDEAKDWPADLIVMGTHGYTGLKKLVLGSVAQSVVSHAPCSVEVVRDRIAADGKKSKDQAGQIEEPYSHK